MWVSTTDLDRTWAMSYPQGMRAVAAVAVLLIGSSNVRAEGTTVAPSAAPSAEVIAKLRVYVDARGRVLAHLADFKKADDPATLYSFSYFGDKTTLRVMFGQRQSDDLQIWDPRVMASFTFKGNQAIAHCGDSEAATFTELPAAETRRLLGKVTFKPALWNRAGYLFARDDGTTYIFVDRARDPEQNTEYKLFVGKRGAMKEQRILDMAADEVGDVLVTAAGTLRTTLVLRNRVRTIDTATWTPAKAKQPSPTPLIMVPLGSKMIFGDLGVYTGKPLGTPCD